MQDDFARRLEDRFRGPSASVRARQEAYLPLVRLLKEHVDGPALDLGCGRGEWLQVLTDEGFDAVGVDLDARLVDDCVEAGLDAWQGDAVHALENEKEGTLSLVTAFHLVEHLAPEEVRRLLHAAHRALRPGGTLLVETPNPENILVATHDFYLDPSHRNPIPPPLLVFLAEDAGFDRVTPLRLHSDQETTTPSLRTALSGASRDHSILAVKPGGPNKEFDEFLQPFAGVSSFTLAGRFDAAMERLERAAREIPRLQGMLQRVESDVKRDVEAFDGSTAAATASLERLAGRLSPMEERIESLATDAASRRWQYGIARPSLDPASPLVRPDGRPIRVAICSLFRNSAAGVAPYFRRLRRLRHIAWHSVAVEGDSEDDTLQRLRIEEARDARVRVVKHDTGCPHYGSVVDPDRFAILARSANRAVKAAMETSPDFVLWIESDVKWPADLIERLARSRRPIVAPMVFASRAKLGLRGVRVGPSRFFYDTWAFRAQEGENVTNFVHDPPYHPALSRGALAPVASAGTCLLIRAEVLEAGARFREEDAIVGLCEEAAARGSGTWVDPTTSIRHPYPRGWVVGWRRGFRGKVGAAA